MKIALVCPSFYPNIGGVETVVFQLASNLARLGNEVTVLAQNSNNQLPKAAKISSFNVVRFNTLGFGELKISFGLLNYLQKNSSKFDIIHIHNYHSFPALAAALTKRVPIIFSPHYHGTGHSMLTYLLHYPYRFLGRFIFSMSDAIICDTTSEAKLVKKHFSNIKEITVISPAIDVESIQKAKKNKDKSALILSVGRLETYKNTEIIIRTLQLIDKKIKLVSVGDGPQLSELKRITEKLNLKNRVTFLSHVAKKELFSLFKSAKVFITMSSMEAYGLSLLEAAAAEIGIVASKIPSHIELVNKFEIKNVSLVDLNSNIGTVAKSVMEAMLKSAKAEKKLPSWKDVTEQVLGIYKKYA